MSSRSSRPRPRPRARSEAQLLAEARRVERQRLSRLRLVDCRNDFDFCLREVPGLSPEQIAAVSSLFGRFSAEVVSAIAVQVDESLQYSGYSSGGDSAQALEMAADSAACAVQAFRE